MRTIQVGDVFIVHYTSGISWKRTLELIQDDLWYFIDLQLNKRGVLNTQSSAIEWIELLEGKE